MAEKVQQILSDSKAARWTALLIISFTMFAGYLLADIMAPLQGLVRSQLLWTDTEYGFFTSAYGWFNVFFFLLIIGGIILDRFGIRVTGLGAALIMVAGTGLKYFAISSPSLATQTVTLPILGTWKTQVMLAALGYAIFGVGVEIAGITASKTIVKWFKGKEMALAMGMQISVARLGTALALATSLPLAKATGKVSTPILMALIMLCIGVLAFTMYIFMDRKLDASIMKAKGENPDEPAGDDEKFKLSDIFKILGNRGWWYIALLCVLFYSAVFPFLKYATDLMVQKFNVPANWAGALPGLLPFGTIFFTPLFGGIYDKIGKGATIMIVGSVIITTVHLLFSLPFLNHWIFAIFLMMALGVGFSLVPSAMWPSVPKIIPERQLGTAFSLIFWVQNWGLMGVPALIGWVLDKYCITGTKTVGTTVIKTYN